MEDIRQYIISVAAAAILCAILRELLPEKGTAASLFRLISGIFLAFVVISPIRDIQVRDMNIYIDSFSKQGEVIAADAELQTREAMQEIIKAETEAYILDKARSLGSSITVDISFSDADIPVPQSVCLIGSVSPYVRTTLEAILEEELGIAKEDQTWIG